MAANITLRLRGLVSQNGQDKYIADAANQTYQQGNWMSTESISSYDQVEIISALLTSTRKITAVLREIDRGNPVDSARQLIDPRVQIDELGHLSQTMSNMTKITLGFLASDLGKMKWNNGIIIIFNRAVNIEDECIGLSKLVKRMEVAQVNIRRQIDRENVMVITLILGPVLYADILGIVGQYMD